MQSDPKNSGDDREPDGEHTAGNEGASFEEGTVETTVLPDAEFTDNVGDVSVEINVEELVATVEAEQSDDAGRKKEIRRRLEELAETKEFDDTYAVDFDD